MVTMMSAGARSCDLHLGDSRLQYYFTGCLPWPRCDLHLGDSRLQSYNQAHDRARVVICI